MPKRKKTFGLRLRTRGGTSARKQWTRITMEKRRRHKCPRCSSPSVKRDYVGVWDCSKCGFRFAGGAYTPSTRMGQASQRIR
ncbi:50S ribosomal protein L37ae [Candidatus Bathyarchaeota archaeon]|nr:MAG: 50S ribosomal protein L37ae [Candidatus Bathyarchaeota archaeon]